jgi:hypothetical protein
MTFFLLFMFSKEESRPAWKWNLERGNRETGNRGDHSLLKLAISYVTPGPWWGMAGLAL